MELIRSRDNPGIKQLVSLLTRKKERDETGLFAAEGLRLCADILESGLPVEKLFVTFQALEKYPRAKLLAERARQVLIVSEDLFERISDTKSSQGVCCIAPKPDTAPASDAVRADGLYLLLAGLQDPGNLGAIVRTAEALGVDGVGLAHCPDLFSPKVLRASMGGVFRLFVWNFADFHEAARLFREKQVPLYAAALDREAMSVEEVDFTQGGVVLIGNEGSGLSEEQVDACEKTLCIPMPGGAESLGAAMAAGIVAWEMTRGRRNGDGR